MENSKEANEVVYPLAVLTIFSPFLLPISLSQ